MPSKIPAVKSLELSSEATTGFFTEVLAENRKHKRTYIKTFINQYIWLGKMIFGDKTFFLLKAQLKKMFTAKWLQSS